MNTIIVVAGTLMATLWVSQQVFPAAEKFDKHGAVEPKYLTRDGKMQLKYLFRADGVLNTYSMDFKNEIKHMLDIMPLKPGMTYCEMGPGDGTFFAMMAKEVMPGGKAVMVAPVQAELDLSREAALASCIPKDTIVQVLSTNDPAALGIEAGTCDYFYSRMVYHMIPADTAKAYTSQIAKALKSDGVYFATDHDPDNGIYTRPDAALMPGIDGVEKIMPKGMPVVPIAVEIAEYTAGGLKLERIIRSWPYFADPKYGVKFDDMGFGLVFSKA